VTLLITLVIIHLLTIERVAGGRGLPSLDPALRVLAKRLAHAAPVNRQPASKGHEGADDGPRATAAGRSDHRHDFRARLAGVEIRVHEEAEKAMTKRHEGIPIRPDVHARFVALVARADSGVEDERRALQRRLATALARETREGGPHDADDDRSIRSPRDAAGHHTTEGQRVGGVR
jgi:hypothetical protein